MSYRLSVDVIGSKELEAAFRKAPQVTMAALSKGIGKTAYRIEARAKQLAPIDKANLRGSINIDGPHATLNNVEAKVGTNIEYAPHQEYGTGVYGKTGQPIRPKNARILAWKSGGKWHFARQVRGVKPKRFFGQSRQEARPYMTEQMRGALTEIVTHLAR
jgi:phage gpG-like protein